MKTFTFVVDDGHTYSDRVLEGVPIEIKIGVDGGEPRLLSVRLVESSANAQSLDTALGQVRAFFERLDKRDFQDFAYYEMMNAYDDHHRSAAFDLLMILTDKPSPA